MSLSAEKLKTTEELLSVPVAPWHETLGQVETSSLIDTINCTYNYLTTAYILRLAITHCWLSSHAPKVNLSYQDHHTICTNEWPADLDKGMVTVIMWIINKVCAIARDYWGRRFDPWGHLDLDITTFHECVLWLHLSSVWNPLLGLT